MSIETAFLLGVLIGQWWMLWVFWRASVRLLRLLGYIETRNASKSSQNKEIIILPSEDDPDEDSY